EEHDDHVPPGQETDHAQGEQDRPHDQGVGQDGRIAHVGRRSPRLKSGVLGPYSGCRLTGAGTGLSRLDAIAMAPIRATSRIVPATSRLIRWSWKMVAPRAPTVSTRNSGLSSGRGNSASSGTAERYDR